MSKTKFTPGPWRTEDRGLKHVIVGSNNWQVGALRQTPKLNRADAALIAAAPELYEALEKVIRINGSTGGPEAVLKELKFIAEQALAKARGES